MITPTIIVYILLVYKYLKIAGTHYMFFHMVPPWGTIFTLEAWENSSQHSMHWNLESENCVLPYKGTVWRYGMGL